MNPLLLSVERHQEGTTQYYDYILVYMLIPFLLCCTRLFIRSFIPMPNQVPIYHMFLNASDDAIDLVSR